MMKTKIATAPMASEMAPARIASAPSSAPTVCCCSTFSGAGRAPARSSTARSLADSVVKRPVICPEPLGITPWMTGAEITFLSRTMANFLPMLCAVTSANLRAPTLLKRNCTTLPPLFWSKPGEALVSISPVTTARFSTT